MSAYEPVKQHLAPEEWDYWYEGKPAAKALSDPLGNVIVPKDEVRDGDERVSDPGCVILDDGALTGAVAFFRNL